jgi:4-carboxymuconolactone decarboxylase
MMSGDSLERGKALRTEMFGKLMPAAAAPTSAYRQPFEDLVNEYCFGEVWADETIPRKIRSMLTIAVLASIAKPNQLRAHVKGAIANGATKEEIRAVLTHVAIYAGVPAGVDGLANAIEAMKEIGIPEE